MQGIIYLITNKITGQMYVGQTIRTLRERWNGHCKQRGDCRIISSAIKKHTPEQFYIDQIDSASSYSELNWKEAYWITKLNTLSPNGYNLHSGGRGHQISEETRKQQSLSQLGRKHPEDVKLKISKSHLGKRYNFGNTHTLGYKHSNEARLNMSKGQHGRKLSEEAKLKISQKKMGKPRPKAPEKKFKGVYRSKKYFIATITAMGCRIYLGNFKSDVEAAKAYDMAALIYHPEGRHLNFPELINTQNKKPVQLSLFN